MAKAIAPIAIGQSVVTALLQSRQIQIFESKISNGVKQAMSLALEQKSVAGLNMLQTIPHGMDELQTHTNPTFQPFGMDNDGYLSSDSSSIPSKEPRSSHAEVESSNTVIMPIIVMEATNFEEQLVSMKDTLG